MGAWCMFCCLAWDDAWMGGCEWDGSHLTVASRVMLVCVFVVMKWSK